MQLTEEQKRTVSGWFAAGATLDEIQKRLRSEFDLHLTYLDVRLMVAELPQPAEPAATEPEEAAEPAPDALSPDETIETEPLPPDEGAPEDNAPGVGVKVEVDALTIPGTIASGEVTFSDGQKGKWYVDQMGRLGLGGDLPQGYRPSPEDAAVFQSNLMAALRAKGIA